MIKRISFFLVLFFFPFTVFADTIKHFEVLNGKLSIPFDPMVNTYTVYLVDNEEHIKANYALKDEKNTVEIKEDDEKVIYIVKDEDKEIEKYYFYKQKNEVESVFHEIKKDNQEQKIIPHLKEYVIGICFLLIIILFKIIVLGFKKKKKIIK